MSESRDTACDPSEAPFVVNGRVRVQSGLYGDARGVVVEDFGDTTGVAVAIGTIHIADAARRWAVLLDNGVLVFLDTEQLRPE